MSELEFAMGEDMCACISHMEECGRDCCIRGYHICKEIWRAAMGEELECDREPENLCGRYAVAVKRSGVVISHLPQKLSKVCSLFLRRGGVISCTETGLEIVQNPHRSHQYSHCLERTLTRTP